jgi:ubiquinone/menaquinone biosynthesis C-methylase UbiE
MFKRILHGIASHPWAYDQIQALLGLPFSQALLRERLSFISADACVVDVGGGTGIFRACLPSSVSYTCLDIDPVKLKGFHSKFPQERALLADALQLPMKSRSVDVALCIAVIHHIPDAYVDQLFGEAMRILKPRGRVVVLDPIWDPTRLRGRLIWSYDRGSYPRTAESIQSKLAAHGTIVHWEQYAIHHRYVLGIVTPR